MSGTVPHNEYLRILVESGVLGLVIMFVLTTTMLFRLFRQRGSENPSRQLAGALGFAIVVGLLVNAIAANTLLYTPAAYLLAFVLAALARVGTATDEQDLREAAATRNSTLAARTR